MSKIISPREEKAKQIEKLYWPETTIRYGEDTAFEAARVYAGAITGWQEIFEKKNALIRRAAELLNEAESNISWEHGLFTPYWHKLRDQWLKDAGLGK